MAVPVIGVWSEIPASGRWANEGISRIVGFLIEGSARLKTFRFLIVTRTGMADTVRVDLRQLQATEHVDWEVVEKPAGFSAELTQKERNACQRYSIDLDCALQAVFANQRLEVDGWIVTFPHFTGAMLLTAPRATMLPDAIPFDFPLGWNEEAFWGVRGEWQVWREKAGEALRASDVIIAHSQHVAERHGIDLLSCDRAHIAVIPHAPPDLAHLVPHIQYRRRTEASHSLAASLLRQHALESGNTYLASFPFEECEYIVVSTQDRPTKNLIRAAEATALLVRDHFQDIKMLMTAGLHRGADWTRLPAYVDQAGLIFDIQSLRDLPRDVHAALYHCAAVTVHPSFYEGIVGTLTFYESVSLGTPCVLARGPHVNELLERFPVLARSVFDPYDSLSLLNCIAETLCNRREILELQQQIFSTLSDRSWDIVAAEYIDAILSGARD